ncbi:NDP-hexose 2,3-dehydratase family protein [Streptomyces sp. ISL-100]|uniref:NDP-hexose 2,3-dehydratase family protein n=1 Tax=Streptomyces sp. ISL-100 TaxID=2819173 RepID=UPI001BED1425|nr:NDP-hexose 2,3-dehydratase family protein [Streptomyces sp. ISL-100]MBT2399311.1 NDP-hexose 2,3-dehydratase family protein [Streptomyces sp. ISL-100]
MTAYAATSAPALTAYAEDLLSRRLARSAAARTDGVTALSDYHQWFAACAERSSTEVEPVPLDELTGWHREPGTGNLVHDSGRFFSVGGVSVERPGAAVPGWSQPVINQPETGILGILMSEFDGVAHFLMQAKVEPGNHNGLQLSPTVQATRSNYTGAHRGRPVPYVEYFRNAAQHTVIADVRQSEQGAWFYRKRNRNMIVEVREPVEVRNGFRWLTLGQVHELLALDDMVNMDSRAVLSCLPFTGPGVAQAAASSPDAFQTALLRSCEIGADDGRHTTAEILNWITETRSTTELLVRQVPLNQVTGWRAADGRISHESGLFFDVMGVRVRARGREVDQWTQPLIAAGRTGLIAFLTSRINGVLHVLVQAKAEPGHNDVIELAPTVQCTPTNYAVLPAEARPPFLDEVLDADPRRIRFDTTLSEEGGRFYHTRNRYLVVEADDSEAGDHPGFRWVTLRQLTDLLRHSYYLNVEARSLVACLRSLLAGPQ